jgi:hypothetical protein
LHISVSKSQIEVVKGKVFDSKARSQSCSRLDAALQSNACPKCVNFAVIQRARSRI